WQVLLHELELLADPPAAAAASVLSQHPASSSAAAAPADKAGGFNNATANSTNPRNSNSGNTASGSSSDTTNRTATDNIANGFTNASSPVLLSMLESLDDVSLLLAEDLLDRMSQHWRQRLKQQQQQEQQQDQDQEPQQQHAQTAGRQQNQESEPQSEQGQQGQPAGQQEAAAALLKGDDGDGDSGGTSSSGASAKSSSTSTTTTTSSSDSVNGRRGRQLLQDPQVSANYANAFRLVFGNFFDLVGGALRYLALLAGEANLALLNLRWIRDLSYLASAPLDNIVNSNWLPLPGDNNELRALLTTALNDYCAPELVAPTQLRLGEFRGPIFSLAITPAVCPIRVDADSGRRSINWDNCIPARLTILLTPNTYSTPRYTAPSYRGQSCRYSRAFGTDFIFSEGGGTTSFTFRTSARQLDIVPVLNQYFFQARFSRFNAENTALFNVTGGPSLARNSFAAPAPGSGTNTAIVFRAANETTTASTSTSASRSWASEPTDGGGVAADTGDLEAIRDEPPEVYDRAASSGVRQQGMGLAAAGQQQQEGWKQRQEGGGLERGSVLGSQEQRQQQQQQAEGHRSPPLATAPAAAAAAPAADAAAPAADAEESAAQPPPTLSPPAPGPPPQQLQPVSPFGLPQLPLPLPAESPAANASGYGSWDGVLPYMARSRTQSQQVGSTQVKQPLQQQQHQPPRHSGNVPAHDRPMTPLPPPPPPPPYGGGQLTSDVITDAVVPYNRHHRAVPAVLTSPPPPPLLRLTTPPSLASAPASALLPPPPQPQPPLVAAESSTPPPSAAAASGGDGQQDRILPYIPGTISSRAHQSLSASSLPSSRLTEAEADVGPGTQKGEGDARGAGAGAGKDGSLTTEAVELYEVTHNRRSPHPPPPPPAAAATLRSPPSVPPPKRRGSEP
ncbi:hypothetical protein Agub_g5552, partial [Astrephomene gubernaculifera]